MFDMTLMMCLLKHLAGLDIGDKLPVKFNIKVVDDLSRLKWYRNLCCHSSQTEMDTNTFETFSEDILQVI